MIVLTLALPGAAVLGALMSGLFDPSRAATASGFSLGGGLGPAGGAGRLPGEYERMLGFWLLRSARLALLAAVVRVAAGEAAGGCTGLRAFGGGSASRVLDKAKRKNSKRNYNVAHTLRKFP